MENQINGSLTSEALTGDEFSPMNEGVYDFSSQPDSLNSLHQEYESIWRSYANMIEIIKNYHKSL